MDRKYQNYGKSRVLKRKELTQNLAIKLVKYRRKQEKIQIKSEMKKVFQFKLSAENKDGRVLEGMRSIQFKEWV